MESTRNRRCIIIDDEVNAIDIIDHYLDDFPHIDVLARFTNAIEANNWLKINKIDLIFLDIQMPGISGIDLLRSLKDPPAVFLTTAYRHYAPEAFDLNVLDYLLKPISPSRFRKAMEKFDDHIRIKEIDNGPSEEKITIRANRTDIRVNPSDIIFIESMGDYLKVHLRDKNLLTKETLRKFRERLPSSFRQVHRSYIVNSGFIEAETSSSITIFGTELPKSKSYR